MDEVRSRRTLKPGNTASKDRAPSKRVSQPKSLLRTKAVEALTPLHRLAKFKEIRDRNLARSQYLRKTTVTQFKPLNSVFEQRPSTMETKINGVNKSELSTAKSKNVEHISNGSEDRKQSNGLEEHATNGGGITESLKVDQGEIVIEISNEGKLPKSGGKVREKGVPQIDPNVSDANEIDEESDSDSGEGGQESEGSSLDVVGGSSAESLDLQVSRQSSVDDLIDDAVVPGPSKSVEINPKPSTAEPQSEKMPTPEIIRRLNAGGKILSRRNLRGEYASPQLKRKYDSENDSSSAKRSRDDGTLSSPGWKFFSPTRTLTKFWSPFASSPSQAAGPSSTLDIDDSMVVNLDEQSNYFEKLQDDATSTLIEDSQEKPTQKWCAIM